MHEQRTQQHDVVAIWGERGGRLSQQHGENGAKDSSQQQLPTSPHTQRERVCACVCAPCLRASSSAARMSAAATPRRCAALATHTFDRYARRRAAPSCTACAFKYHRAFHSSQSWCSWLFAFSQSIDNHTSPAHKLCTQVNTHKHTYAGLAANELLRRQHCSYIQVKTANHNARWHAILCWQLGRGIQLLCRLRRSVPDTAA